MYYTFKINDTHMFIGIYMTNIDYFYLTTADLLISLLCK